ncbi:MAG: hypothetical protein D8M57_20065 [Candidatus Scalindua sp. AMX11]|nr:MAG: hypothetical protein D8M57_20065 [Candidatus Scalindua sp. AMX11]
MNDLTEYKSRLQERIDYKNFSEDVEILAENNIDDNLSLYTVKNKNNVTFQNVPGMAWIGLGKLGFVNGERNRPILLGTSDIDVKIKSGKFSSRDNSPGSNQVSSGITVIMEFTWDIQLEATRGAEVVTKTKSSYIRVI